MASRPPPRHHADEVVVTDLSERALAYAAFNAALNSVDWQIRGGSMLEPVAGEQFSLIVSNPPFVITPRSGMFLFEYRDGGASGDAIVADLVRSIGAHLEPGGIAQFSETGRCGRGALAGPGWAAGWSARAWMPGSSSARSRTGGVRRDMGA